MTQSPRAQARADTIDQIKQIAREHLARDGADLSLRAVARELGVVSSAVYRYFASRDDLLTALIIDAYDAMADAVEAAEAAVPRRDVVKRWTAVCRGVRSWSRERPAEFALLYGTPVPGYSAPQDTVGPGLRVQALALTVVRDAHERGRLEVPAVRLPRGVRDDMTAIGQLIELGDLPASALALMMGVWAQLFGLVSFELFGRYRNGITDWDGFFDLQVAAMAREVGLR